MAIETFRFLRWKVYEDCQQLFSQVLAIVHALPREHRFPIGDQLVRSGLSPILNIAEGSGKSTRKELARYLDIALGSLYETTACLDTLSRNGLITDAKRDALLEHIGGICRQLGGLKRKLKQGE